ncbi:MAG: CehA/McbA family metallohydrolase, partial [Thermoanaerobaculia bacterium]
CGRAREETKPSMSPRPQLEIVEALRQDLEAVRHPSDGGGKAWIADGDASSLEVMAGSPGQWTLLYEAGPLGIAEGGWLFVQAPPFWGWSAPQVLNQEGVGFSLVSTAAEGVVLDAQTVDQGLLGIEIQGRPLEEGERVQVVYGAGDLGAVADRFAESESAFFVAVDGNGDGVRKLVPGPLNVRVLAGPAAQMVVILPSTARPGEQFSIRVSILDATGSAGVKVEGEISLRAEGFRDLPAVVEMTSVQRGVLQLEATVENEGIFRIEATGPYDLQATSNPLVVSSDGESIVWGDLHGHSALSDGTGTVEDYFGYARDVAGLDVVALTDHDHWGMEPLALNPEFWSEIRRQVESFYRAGEFVTLLGYEWTNWIHGHRHVLYFSSEGEVLSSVDPDFESPDQLWDALRGEPALTVAHHSAGGPIPTNWEFPPDPELEPITEIVSVHGSSEAMDSPGLIYSPLPGNFVRDVLDRGFKFGFVGSGDSHDGHPGLAHLASPSGGLAAFLAEDLTREGILRALRSRRVYATNGPRIVLATRLGGQPMGDDIELAGLKKDSAAGQDVELSVRVVAQGPLDRIDVIRSGQVHLSVACDEQTECSFVRTLVGLHPGEYVYARAVQADGGTAWSSPNYLH